MNDIINDDINLGPEDRARALLPVAVDQACAEVKPTLEAIERQLGFAPNLHRVLAHAPPALDSYVQLTKLFARTSLSSVEREVVLIAASRQNACGYCVAAHSMLAEGAGMAIEDLAALRRGEPLPDPRLGALAALAGELVSGGGKASAETLAAFEAAGYTRAQALEVVVGLALKTLSNFSVHLAEIPLDAASASWALPEE